jgi:hypothetical protein
VIFVLLPRSRRFDVSWAAFTAPQLEAARYWADADGADSVGRLLDDAVTLVEPLIAAL